MERLVWKHVSNPFYSYKLIYWTALLPGQPTVDQLLETFTALIKVSIDTKLLTEYRMMLSFLNYRHVIYPVIFYWGLQVIRLIDLKKWCIKICYHVTSKHMLVCLKVWVFLFLFLAFTIFDIWLLCCWKYIMYQCVVVRQWHAPTCLRWSTGDWA